MHKKKYVVIIALISILLMGCSKNYMASIYDNNEKISSNTNSFNMNIEEQSIDGQQFKGEIKKIEGMDTIWTYEADKDEKLDMTYNIDVTSGKLKLVLISPDNSITNIIETDDKSDETSTIKLKKGLNRIKVVAGKDTSAELDIKIPNGKFKELGMVN